MRNRLQHVDRLDGFVVEQRFVAAVMFRDTAISGKGLRGGGIAAGDGFNGSIGSRSDKKLALLPRIHYKLRPKRNKRLR